MQNKASQGLDSILTFLWSEEGVYWYWFTMKFKIEMSKQTVGKTVSRSFIYYVNITLYDI